MKVTIPQKIRQLFSKKKPTHFGGIYTADPEICPNVRLIEEISYEEMLELCSSCGTNFPINPRAVEIAMLNKVPILYTSVENFPKGTLVHDCPSLKEKK